MNKLKLFLNRIICYFSEHDYEIVKIIICNNFVSRGIRCKRCEFIKGTKIL